MENIWFLKKCGLFERLSEIELRRLESVSRSRRFERGSPIYLPADEASCVLLLTSGRVKICNFTSEGKQAILTFIEPGELFGELALFDHSQRDEYAEAVDASTVVLIPGEAIEQLMETRADVSLGVTKLMGFRRRRIERRLKYLLFRSNRERLVHLLLELAEEYGRRTVDGIQIDLRLSHQDLASIIGSTRETVTVILGELMNERFLKLGRKRVIIRDVIRLAQSVEATPPRLVREMEQMPAVPR